MKVSGKTWVVTGGGSGMGRELCLQLLEKGGNVALVDINERGMKETAELAGAHRFRLSLHSLDITDKARVDLLPNQVIEKHGTIDGLINNAGIIQPFIRVAELSDEAIARVMNINFYGLLYMTRAFLPHLMERPEAHLVNVSSMGGFLPVPGQTVYGASKAAVKLFTEGLHSEMQGTNVNVTIIFPGAVATNITANSGVEVPSVASKESSNYKTLEANRAAEIMINGIEQNKYRILVGTDAKMMDRLYRLAPEWAAAFIAKKMKDLLAK